MSFLFKLVLFALSSCIGLTHGTSKFFTVDGIKKCVSKSSELNECVKSNVKVVWPRLIKGVKEFCIPSLDPYELRNVEFSYDGTAFSGKLVASNIKINGLEKLQINSVDVKVSDKKKIILKSKFSVSKLKITGSYSGQIRVTLLKVKPRGTFNLFIDDVEIEATAEAELSSRDGHTFGKVTDLKLEPKVGNFKLEVRECVVSSFITSPLIRKVNKEWRKYYDSIMPQTRKNWLPQIVKYINKLSNVTPLESTIDL